MYGTLFAEGKSGFDSGTLSKPEVLNRKMEKCEVLRASFSEG
jgi:hypothetical protein